MITHASQIGWDLYTSALDDRSIERTFADAEKRLELTDASKLMDAHDLLEARRETALHAMRALGYMAMVNDILCEGPVLTTFPAHEDVEKIRRACSASASSPLLRANARAAMDAIGAWWAALP